MIENDGVLICYVKESDISSAQTVMEISVNGAKAPIVCKTYDKTAVGL